MIANAFIRFDTYHEYIEFLDFLDIAPGEIVDMDKFTICIKGDYPELRSIEVILEGCDNE